MTVTAIEAYVRENARKTNETQDYPHDFDERLRGAAAPELVGTARCRGDVIGPFFEVWGE